ncbi:hypothetical protein BU26DRAFT_521069 [Trematosphaeria pertusa]|uniref:BZIP domain-containing protein n=1 Tax=Trematosphaeria pertusa TaxID=390896 RepID=A0A6A6I8D8_9PLEO|nr:uncharacterized protein BU26DRAFT_521069 [Trematosphaeria pertusa]KAF2246616.1 hypothetical protein BU26DRAFT_521069 [Trematosphaeria pertusa]
MASSDSDGQAPPRKRSRTSANSGEDGGAGGKKARGRPRVDTQDETAADRRRTQIRLAQRAYRLRKETTISSLKNRNARLQSIIDQMNKSFLRFNDSALKSGILQLHPSLAQELKHVTETFVALAKSAAEGAHEAEDDFGDATTDPAAEVLQAGASTAGAAQNHQTNQEPQHMNIGWGYTAAIEDAAGQTNFTSTKETGNHLFPSINSPFDKNNQSLVPLRRPVSVGHILDQSTSWTRTPPNEDLNSQHLPFGLIDILSHHEYSPGSQSPDMYSVHVPTPDIIRLPTPPYLPSLSTKTLTPTWTYSHDETTFARRLTRAALETGFHLLSAANQRPAALNYVFKLSLPYMSLNALRERFKMLLARGTDEELDCWETPFIHLGGAGTHYPRKDAKGNEVAIPNSWTVRRIGPISAKMVRAENSADPSQSHDLNIDLTGFEGEWFDAYDVEGYLQQEKGCKIDPKDSFAEVLIDEDHEPTSNDANDFVFAHRALKFNYSHIHKTPSTSSSSNSCSLTTATSSTNSTPVTDTTTISSGHNNVDNIFAPPDAPFGLDMGINLPTSSTDLPVDFPKFPDIDPTTFFDQPLGLDLAPGFDAPFPSATSFADVNFGNTSVDMGTLGLDLMGGETRQLPVIRQRKKKPAWVDVSKLIDEIIKHGVCLGRSPGFRKKDVDMAFQAALITAF